jgi:septal ring factor EnvC (AmiA/AmiB activator)
LDRLERDFRDLATAVSGSLRRRDPRGESAVNRISLVSWLQISGPTFAVLVFGFTVLWNAQQAQTGSLLEVQRSMGRLEGSIDGLDARVGSLEGSIHGLDARVGSLEGSIHGLDARIDKLGNAVDALAKRLGSS